MFVWKPRQFDSHLYIVAEYESIPLTFGEEHVETHCGIPAEMFIEYKFVQADTQDQVFLLFNYWNWPEVQEATQTVPLINWVDKQIMEQT